MMSSFLATSTTGLARFEGTGLITLASSCLSISEGEPLETVVRRSRAGGRLGMLILLGRLYGV